MTDSNFIVSILLFISCRAVGMGWGYRSSLANFPGASFEGWFSNSKMPMAFMAHNHMTRVICGETFSDKVEFNKEGDGSGYGYEMMAADRLEPATRQHLECAKQKLTTHCKKIEHNKLRTGVRTEIPCNQ